MWIHEIKHDGYRLIVRRVEDRVRLFTRRGYDWTNRFPRIVEGAKRLKARSFILDGEAVICGTDGVADFARLHSRAYEDEVTMFGFDLLELNGEDLRAEPLDKRKAGLEKLISRKQADIRFTEHLTRDGDLMFRAACKMGLEGIVSKRRDAPYRPGRCKSWVKIKNPTSPAMMRVEDGTF